MTTKEAIEIARKAPRTNMSTAEHQAINQVCNFAERFEGAFEVEEIQECYDDNLDLMHELYGFNTRLVGTTQTHKLYAIPKEKQ